MDSYIYIHIYIYTCTHTHAYRHTHTYIYIYIHIHIHTYMDTYTYTYAYICTYTHIYWPVRNIFTGEILFVGMISKSAYWVHLVAGGIGYLRALCTYKYVTYLPNFKYTHLHKRYVTVRWFIIPLWLISYYKYTPHHRNHMTFTQSMCSWIFSLFSSYKYEHCPKFTIRIIAKFEFVNTCCNKRCVKCTCALRLQ